MAMDEMWAEAGAQEAERQVQREEDLFQICQCYFQRRPLTNFLPDGEYPNIFEPASGITQMSGLSAINYLLYSPIHLPLLVFFYHPQCAYSLTVSKLIVKLNAQVQRNKIKLQILTINASTTDTYILNVSSYPAIAFY